MKPRLNIVRKDLKLFFRDKRTLLLVLLTPLLIMVVLGNIFSQQEQKEFLGNIKLGLCNYEPEFKLPYEFSFVTFENDCETKAKNLVNKGEIRAALIVPSNFYGQIRKGFGSNLILYVDNAKGQVAFTTTTAIEAMVNKLNEEIGTAFIAEAWVNLRELNEKLKFAVGNLESSKETAVLIQEKTENMTRLLERINVTQAYKAMAKANQSVKALKEELNTSALYINESGLPDFSEETALSASIISNSLELGIILVNKSLASMETIYQTSCLNNSSMMCKALNTSAWELRNASYNLESQRASILNELDRINNLSNMGSDQLSLYKKAVENLTIIVEDIKRNVSTVEDLIALVNEQIGIVEKTKEEASEQVEELHQNVANFTQQIIELQENLNKTSMMLEEYTSKEPQNIVRAVTLTKKESFIGRKSFSFTAPGIILTVLLLVTLLVSSSAIVEERKNATMLRNILAPITLTNFLLQKMLYLFILCLIQLFLMLAVTAFFGVAYALSMEFFIMVVIVAVSFISIGIFIGSLAKSENMSLLISLVAAIPMMFLSGVFFPFEGMPRIMSIIGFYSPLTLAINNAERVLVYATGIDYGLMLILFGISAALFLLSTWLIKKKPTLE